MVNLREEVVEGDGECEMQAVNGERVHGTNIIAQRYAPAQVEKFLREKCPITAPFDVYANGFGTSLFYLDS